MLGELCNIPLPVALRFCSAVGVLCWSRAALTPKAERPSYASRHQTQTLLSSFTSLAAE